MCFSRTAPLVTGRNGMQRGVRGATVWAAILVHMPISATSRFQHPQRSPLPLSAFNDAEFMISTNASKFALSAVLLQKGLIRNLRPFACSAKVLSPAHTNYPTYDQDLLGNVCALTEWRCYIEGNAKITNITDHATLRHLTTQKSLGRRHAIWPNELFPYLAIIPRTNEPNMEIVYRKCLSNEANALSRRPELHHTIATAETKNTR
jgi:hypothetical protein